MVLSISLLVSNRIDTIRKCMESLKPILEAIPSELIAVDTVEPGKSDGSIGVVREYTEKIVPFVWCNDFAAARNAGLKEAQGEWFMYIDDDEWLEDSSPIIAFFESGEYKKYKYASYTVRNYTNPEGSRWVDTLQGRLFPIDKDTCFVGRIHEAVSWQEPACELLCYAHHYGYAYKTAEDRDRHIERNLKLLQEEYERNRGNLRWAAHLIQEYEQGGRFEESLKVIQKSLEEASPDSDNKYWHFLRLHEVLGYIRLGKFDRAYERGNAYLQGENLLMGAEAGIRCLMSEICDVLGRYEEGLRHLKKYLELTDRITKREDRASLTVLEISQMWNEINIKQAYARGINLAYRLGDLGQTAYFIRKIDWREKELQLLDGTVDNLFRFFGKAPFESWMTDVMEAILERGFSKGGMDDVLTSIASGSLERRHILQILASCANHSAQVSLYRAEYAVLSGNPELLRQALGELVEHPDGNLLMLEDTILQYLYEAGIDGEEYVAKVPFYKWHLCVEQWNKKKILQVKKRECFLWRGMMPSQPLYLLEMEVALQVEETRSCIEDGRTFPELYRSFLMMAEKTHQLYSRIYHPGAFTEERLFTVLSPEVQFAEKYRTAARYLEQGEEKKFVSHVKEAGICCPSMGKGCRLLLEKYRDEQDGENREAGAELTVLIQMLEQRAERMWEDGQTEEAATIIKQILRIRPDEKLAEKYHITG